MRHVMNFQKQFAPLVESGAKLQTVRAPRKRPICVGDDLRLYTGLRTRACRLIGEGRVSHVIGITINAEWPAIRLNTVGPFEDWDLPGGEDKFARADGFEGWPQMQQWFLRTHGLPFYGLLIIWRLTPCAP